MTNTTPKPDPAMLYTWNHPDWRLLFDGSMERLIAHNAGHHRRRETIRTLAVEMMRSAIAGEITPPRPVPPRIRLDDDDVPR